MVSQPPPPQGRNDGLFSHSPNSSSIFMCNEDMNVTMRAKSYDVLESISYPKDSFAPSTSTGPITLGNPLEPIYCPPKGVIHKVTHNPSARATKNYSIFKYISQGPCAMSPLEALKNCPQQHKELLSMIGELDLSNSILSCMSSIRIFITPGQMKALPLVSCQYQC